MNSLDLARLGKVKHRGGKIICQCPACAESGGDRAGEHLAIFDDGAGRWGCVAHAGDKEHRRRIAKLAGTRSVALRPKPIPTRRAATSHHSLKLPPLRIPTVGELARLADVRGLPFFAGCELAVRAGQLRFADLRDGDESVVAWTLSDSSCRNAQARRLDGKPWRGIDAKAKTLRGSQAAWPIGAADIGAKPFVALCEGGPDTLAAWSLAWWHGLANELAPICMAGSHPMHAEALPLFRGKGVFLVPHRDDAGQRAREAWTAQLRNAGAAWVRPFDVGPAKDLNECLTAAAAHLEDDYAD